MIQLKNLFELQKIRESCQLLTETYKEVTRNIQIGMTTADLDKIAYNFITKNGAVPAFLNYHGYPGSMCISLNEQVIHGIPGKRIIRDGDILSLDCGLVLDGYYSDSAYSFPIGNISQEKKDLLRVTEECLYLAIAEVKPGNRIRDISEAVEKNAKKNGYGIVREFCGHGVGLELHEDPQIPNYVGRGPNPRLKNGMIFAIEPMINMGTGEVVILDDDWTVVTADGLPSAHFEHTVALFDDKVEILTNFDFAKEFHI